MNYYFLAKYQLTVNPIRTLIQQPEWTHAVTRTGILWWYHVNKYRAPVSCKHPLIPLFVEAKTQDNDFLFLNFDTVFRIEHQKHLLTIDELNELE